MPLCNVTWVVACPRAGVDRHTPFLFAYCAVPFVNYCVPLPLIVEGPRWHRLDNSMCRQEGRHHQPVRAPQGTAANDDALSHVGGSTACHPLHGNGLDFHVLERADEPEVGTDWVSGRS